MIMSGIELDLSFQKSRQKVHLLTILRCMPESSNEKLIKTAKEVITGDCMFQCQEHCSHAPGVR